MGGENKLEHLVRLKFGKEQWGKLNNNLLEKLDVEVEVFVNPFASDRAYKNLS